MRATLVIPTDALSLAAALRGVVDVNVLLMTRARQLGKPLPPLYMSGVRYRPERGTEDWRCCLEVFEKGFGDCEDLAALRAAELQVAGERDARAVVIQTGRNMFHAIVRRADGSLEDPSRNLGMGRKPRNAKRTR